MTDFILAQENLPFTISLGLMVGIGLLEGVTTLLGFGASSFIESLMPDFDIDLDLDADADISHGGDIGSASALSKLLSWFNIGRVPILVLFILFLLGFGMIGLAIQSVVYNATGRLFPGVLPSLMAFGGATVFVKFSGMALGKIIPKDETEAVSEDSFVGRVATMTLGTATRGQPAQAKLQDSYGQTHYIMLEPDSDEGIFETGTDVLVVRHAGAVFYAIPNPSHALTDKAISDK